MTSVLLGELMSSTALQWLIIYGIGYPIWLGYAINRFISKHSLGDGEEVFHAFIALLWPICVVVYVPYRIFRWVGVRRDC